MAFVPDMAIDKMTELSAGAWRLYCVLARCRNQKTGKCCPSVQTSAEAIGVHPRNIFRLRNELIAAGWAKFDGSNVIQLFGFESAKNATTNVDNTEVAAKSGKNATGKIATGKNASQKWQKWHSNSGKNASDIYEEPAKENQQIEPSMQQQRESRFSTEQITQYIKATKQHVYSVSGLTRYLKSNGEEDELIAEWIEAREMADWPKWVFDPKEPGTVEEKKRFHLELCEAQRRAEAEALAFNQQQSAEEGAA